MYTLGLLRRRRIGLKGCRRPTAKPILIDLPLQSIHIGKVGQKLAAGVGSGAGMTNGQIKEATGIAGFIAVYLCLQK
ncbi:hypothetical protein IEO21_06640 [Rhodonia placenta]|uniref:Uncharacterized protein n=1 Tax=Rhodonia placenta TaxID=104341 RepID=A0A8H7NZJ7_9APHY|nr:hypothetical protein IEO21_06640 [Postia placenta]